VQSQPTIGEYFLGGFRAADYDCDLGYEPSVSELGSVLRGLAVDAVVAGTESGVLLADALSNLLLLPGNDHSTRFGRRDKKRMAAAAEAAGLATPRSRTFNDADDAAAWYAIAGVGDVVVKPLNSAGSDHVRFCRNVPAVRTAVTAVLASANVYGEPNREVLVQERVRGVEFYVNAVSHEGTHRAAEIWRYTKLESPDGAPLYDFEEPVPLGSGVAEQVKAFAFAVLDALGVQSSASHTELMLTERGPVLIECGARLGGATLPDVVERHLEVSQAALYARALLDPPTLKAFDDAAPRPTQRLRNVALRNQRVGRVRSERWRECIQALPTTVAVTASLSAGTELPVTRDLLTSPGYVYFASDDPAAVKRDYLRLRQLEVEGLYTS
jgi:biotin carboxylase